MTGRQRGQRVDPGLGPPRDGVLYYTGRGLKFPNRNLLHHPNRPAPPDVNVHTDDYAEAISDRHAKPRSRAG